jgi:hypothetical protein
MVIAAEKKQNNRKNKKEKKGAASFKSSKGAIIQTKSNKMNLYVSPLAKRFCNAMERPFDPTTLGARIPDPWSFPTSTYHIHNETVLALNATTNQHTMIFLPSPLISMFDLQRMSTGGAASVLASGMAIVGPSMSSGVYGATNLVNMNTLVSQWRPVSNGIRISNQYPELNATGRIQIALVPITGEVPNISFFTNNTANIVNATTTNVARLCLQMFGTDLSNADLLNLPYAQDFPIQDLLHGDLEICGKFTSPSAFTFRNTQTGLTYSTNGFDVTLNDDVAVISTGAATLLDSGYKDTTRMDGQCAIVVRMVGLPSAGSAELLVETIYHIEGSPQTSVSANNTMIPSESIEKPFKGSPIDLESALNLAGDMKRAFRFITKGLEFANKVSGFL